MPRRVHARGPDDMSPNERRSHKRARGPMCPEGQPIRTLLQESIKSADSRTIWHSKKPDDAPDRVIDQQLIGPGRPSEHVADCHTPLDLFSSLLSDDLISDCIVDNTNVKINDLRSTIGPENRGKFTYSDTNLVEMKCFIGVLVMSGIRKDNHLRAKEMFSSVYGCSFYKSLFSQKRFEFLIRAIRFDNAGTREQRKVGDNFCLIRELWESVIVNCTTSWIPGPVLTVDEQLQSCRARCPFRMYLPNKPAKYGIKIFMVCDADSYYCINAIPYLGKDSSPELRDGVNQGEYFTMQLLQPMLEAGRTVCLDNWFTSLHLAKTLQAQRMHLVGTIRQKAYLPSKSVISGLKLGLHESVAFFGHTNKINVVYKRTKSKHVAVMTTLHNTFSYREQTKTEAHMYYNASKGGVDSFDMMCAASSTGRKTRRWPLCNFYGLLNIVMNNAWIIFNSRPVNRGNEKFDFMQLLAFNLCKPYADHRYRESSQHLPHDLRTMMRNTFNLEGEGPPPPPDAEEDPALAEEAPLPARRLSEKRQRCRFCPTASTSSGKVVCNGTFCGGRNVCPRHSVIMCRDCWQQRQ